MASEDSSIEQEANDQQQPDDDYGLDDEQQLDDAYEIDDERLPLVEVGQGKQAYAHPLLATLSFLVAAILLITFFSPLLDGLLRMLLLGGGIVAGMLGVVLLEKRRAPAHAEQESEQAQTLTDFERLVQEALASIPAEFREQMENLVVLVEDEPDASLLEELHEQDEAKDGYLLLGLYQGVPLTQQHYYQAHLPERITIYQNTIERYCHGDPERIREQVRSTVLHEVAHHFGIDHDAMPIWVK